MTVKNGNGKTKLNMLMTGTVIPVSVICGFMYAVYPGIVSAQNPTVTARAGISERFNRFVFEWPFAVGYDTKQNGNSVTVTFSKPAAVNFSSINFDTMKFVKNVSQSSDGAGTTVRFTVPADAQVQSFTLGTKVIVDVLKNTKAPVSFTPPAPATPKPQAAAAVPEKKSEQGNVTERAENIRKALAAARNNDPLNPKNLDIVKTKEEIAAESKAEKNPGKTIEFSDAANKTTASPAEAVKTEDLPSPAEKNEIIGTVPSPEKFANTTLFTVRPAEKTRMAVFTRGGFLWIVFDKVLSDVPPEMEGGLIEDMKPLMRFNVQGGTAFRLSWPFAAGAVNIIPRRNNMTWQIVFAKKDEPMVNISPEIDYVTDPQKPAVVLRTVEKPGKVMIEDPEIGDKIHVVPVFNEKISCAETNRYPKFGLVPAELGIAVRPIDENVIVDVTDDGIRISDKGKPAVSGESDLRSRAPKENLRRNRRMFDLVGWQAGNREFFMRNRRMMERKIIGLEGVSKASGYVDLAKLLVANGLGYEAVGALKVAHDILPDLENSPDFRAILGAAKVLAYRPADAIADLTFDELTVQPEANLWLGFAYARMEEWPKAAEHFSKAENILDTYPDRIKIKILEAEILTDLETGNSVRAAENLSLLNVMPSLYPTDKAAYNYMSGRLLAATGDFTGAEKMLKAAMAIKERLYGVLARYGYFNALYAQGKITAEDAAKRFETIRFSWRGDETEIKSLRRLGQLYLEAGKYSEGMSILREAGLLSKNDAAKQAIAKDMATAFSDLYVKGKSDSLPPIPALSIFNDFRDLLPAGAEGIVALRRLAERMVSVDLLDKAADLYENLVRYHVKDKEAVEIGTRLAVIRLLDHKPENALKALDETESADKTGWDAATVKNRLLLRARALSDIGKTDDAMTLLKDENDFTAFGLKTDINWRAGRWAEAAAELEKLIDYDLQHPEKDNLESVKAQADRVVGFVLKRGIALALAGDQAALKNLYDDYAPLMKETDSEAAFAVVVRPPQPGSLADLQTLKGRVNEVSLFDAFLKKYKSVAPVPEAAQKPEPVPAAPAPEKKAEAAPAAVKAAPAGQHPEKPAAEKPPAEVKNELPPPPAEAEPTKEIKP